MIMPPLDQYAELRKSIVDLKVAGENRDRLPTLELSGREITRVQESVPTAMRQLRDACIRLPATDRDNSNIRDLINHLNVTKCSPDDVHLAVTYGEAFLAEADAHVPKEIGKPKKRVRRNPKYERIDKALQEIAESRPRTQEEILLSLDGRRVATPPAEPFLTARGRMPGFRRDAPAARAWLSKRWAKLNLLSLPRGPKK